MRGRGCFLAGIVSMLAFGAAEAQAGTVFKMCWDFVGCSNTYVADAGEANVLELETSIDEERFRERGQLIRPITPGYTFEGPDSGEPNFAQTTAGCVYVGDSARCTATGPEGAYVYLGDHDDVVHLDGDGWAVQVYGGSGGDTVHSTRPLSFTGGPGPDDLFAPIREEPGLILASALFFYPAEPGVEVAMEIDWDGEADDGAPGEGDNIRPGVGVILDLAGDHRVTGNDGSNIAHASHGDQRMDGYAGRDAFSGGPGADTLDGGRGDDSLSGREGDDLLIAGPGLDLLHGGDGDDVIRARDNESEQVHCDAGNDVAHIDPSDFVFDCETVHVGG